jgi:glycine cleavage system transcriptional repressor
MGTRELLILSATEPDRPGLVTELAGYIAERECNVDDSRVSVLGGYAGLMFLVAGEPEQIAAVLNDLPTFREQTGIRAVARRLETEPSATPAAGTAR